MSELRLGGMGWKRDLPDFRDHTPQSPSVAEVLARSKPLRAAKRKMPASVDLREWCSPIENQGNLGSCTANAGVALFEYFWRRAFGAHLDASRLFLYKVTRNLDNITGDTGAYLRTTMKAMALFGVPPENHWQYDVERFDEEPSAFCYTLGQNFQAEEYYRLDPAGATPGVVLKMVKTALAAGLPPMFGFSVYSSIPGLGVGNGKIPFPSPDDKLEGGHAVVAVGYSDSLKIGKHKGALMIRNSWSADWGEDGYGWLPYAYVQAGLAVDFWSLADAEFVNTALFE